MRFQSRGYQRGDKLEPLLGAVMSGKLSFPFSRSCAENARRMYGFATNQCLRASTICVNVSERLNRLLKKYPGAKTVDNTAFSIAAIQEVSRL